MSVSVTIVPMSSAVSITLLSISASFGPTAWAQGSAAEYELAATLDKRLAGRVRGLDLGYRFSSDGTRLWFERLAAKGGVTAHELTLATGVVTDSVSMDELGEDSPWALTLEPSRPGRRTRRDGPRVTLTIVNRTASPVDVFWIDREGAAVPYGALEPSARLGQQTSVGHVWRVRAGGDDLGDLVTPDGGGALFIQGPATSPPRAEVEERTRSSERDAGPEGRARISVREHDAWLVHDGDEVRLTQDGVDGGAYTGPFVFAPGDAHVALFHERRGAGREVTLIEAAPKEQLQPRKQTLRYDKPGDTLDVRTPRVFDTETGAELPLDVALFPNPWSIRDLHWSADGARLYFVHVERGHRVVKLVEFDTRTGATRVVIDERPSTFFDYANKLFVRHLEATDEVLWMSERSGWNHLWRVHRATGEATPVTQGEWVVRKVEDVDEAARTARIRLMGYYAGQDPYHEHFARVHLETGALVCLTAGDGTHSYEAAPDGAHFVTTWQRVDQPPVREVRRLSDGALVLELSRGDATSATVVLPRPPQRFVGKGRDGVTDIHGVLYRPSHYDPAKRYPVIESIYAGPHGAHVPKTFALGRAQQALAELGFIVGVIDGMGTNWRSKAFHDVAWKDLADSGFPDRVLWWRAAAAADPALDLTRVGIYGGSAGGQSALRAVLDHADFYRAAAADCGCHDNRMDKVWWNELWLGWPIDESYLASSNLVDAHRLGGALLLTVGALDHNVDPASTMQVVQALIDADKDFELIVFPRGGHGIGESPYGRRRRADFFVRELMGVVPRHSAQVGRDGSPR